MYITPKCVLSSICCECVKETSQHQVSTSFVTFLLRSKNMFLWTIITIYYEWIQSESSVSEIYFVSASISKNQSSNFRDFIFIHVCML